MFWPFKKRERRGTFRYWDGAKWRLGDPIVLYRGLLTDREFNVEKHVPELAEGNPEAHKLAVRVVREVFGIPTWTEENQAGLTERETVDVLWEFDAYLDSLKKSTSLSPIWPPATEPPSSETDSTPSVEPDSGSTLGAPIPDKPMEFFPLSPQP